MGVLIKVDGSEEEIVPASGLTFELREVQELLGGLPREVRLGHNEVLLIDVDGVSKGKPINQTATDYLRQHLPGALHIRGNALVVFDREGWW